MTVIFDGVVEVAWGVNPLTDPGSWTDISAYVISCDTSSGKSSERDTFDVGTAQLVVNNSTGRFDPNNASGPYFGNIVPWTHVRVRATYSATTYPVWRGYIVGYTQNYSATSDAALTTLECVDLLGYLAHVQLTSSPLSVSVKLGFEPSQSLTTYTGTGSVSTSMKVRAGVNAGGDLLWGTVLSALPEASRTAGIVRGSAGAARSCDLPGAAASLDAAAKANRVL
jgi:hypothetical protein